MKVNHPLKPPREMQNGGGLARNDVVSPDVMRLQQIHTRNRPENLAASRRSWRQQRTSTDAVTPLQPNTHDDAEQKTDQCAADRACGHSDKCAGAVRTRFRLVQQCLHSPPLQFLVMMLRVGRNRRSPRAERRYSGGWWYDPFIRFPPSTLVVRFDHMIAMRSKHENHDSQDSSGGNLPTWSDREQITGVRANPDHDPR